MRLELQMELLKPEIDIDYRRIIISYLKFALEFSKRHEFLLDRLKLQEQLWMKKHNSADDVVGDIIDNSATLKKPLIPKRREK